MEKANSLERMDNCLKGYGKTEKGMEKAVCRSKEK